MLQTLRNGLAPLGLLLALLLAGGSAAEPATTVSVALTGTMGQRALLVIDGGAPQVVERGQTRDGVTLVSADGDTAVVEIDGQRRTLRVGESPVSVGPKGGPGTQGRVVLKSGRGGHFFGTAKFNGGTLPFLVDTGATDVVLSAAQAQQIGLKFRSGQPTLMSTANGIVPAYRIALDSVRIGEVEVYNVEATVVAGGSVAVLLGNSFLSRFQMKQENDVLTLEKRY